MDLLSVFRRRCLRDKLPIHEIDRRTGLPRNTIRRYLRSGVVEPVFKMPDRPSKLVPYAEKLSLWLRIETGKSRQQWRTVEQMHADIWWSWALTGPMAGWQRSHASGRRRCNMSSAPQGAGHSCCWICLGDAFQFNLSEDWAITAGERVKLQTAHTICCTARRSSCAPKPHNHISWLETHNKPQYPYLGNAVIARPCAFK